ncbi:putative purine-cytosine permease [Dioscorea sansibarensis]
MQSKLLHLHPPHLPFSISPPPSHSSLLHLPHLKHHSFPQLKHISLKSLSLPSSSSSSSSGSLFSSISNNTNLDSNTNSDLSPTSSSNKTFTSWDFATLWISMIIGIPSYYLAGSLVDLGMSWWQGVATIFLANFLLLVPLLLTSIPGTKHGIPFPVLARSSFGVSGAHIPTLLRALIGCGWFGIETWIGGEAIVLLLPSQLKNSIPFAFVPLPGLDIYLLQFICYSIFCLVQICIIWRGIEGINKLEKYSAPVLVALTFALLQWSYQNAGGFSRMLSLSSRLNRSEFWSLFFPAITANIGFWATVALNIPDFTRFARSQKDQIIGQIGLPIFMGLFTFVGLAITSSTEVIFGRVISDPIRLLGMIGGQWTKILAILGIGLATITTNIAANVVAPANALTNLCPEWFTFQRGALVTALLGAAFQPWKLLRSSESFVYTWLLGYSAIMGPIAGIILTDYYLVKHMELDVDALYSQSPQGAYFYQNGFNVVAIMSLVVGILPIIPGFLHKLGILPNTLELFVVLYNNAWFVGFFLSSLMYWILSWRKKMNI